MSDITLKYTEDAPLTLKYTEAKIKPEQDRTVTPDYEGFTVLPDPGATLGSVTVNPIPDPTEVKEITANGDYDVRRFGTAHVAVPEPSGTIAITENGQHPIAGFAVADVDVPQGVFPSGTIAITANGTYDVADCAEAEVNVNTDPVKGFVYENFDDNGQPLKLRLIGFATLPEGIFGNQPNYGYCLVNWAVKEVQINPELTYMSRNSFVQFKSVQYLSLPNVFTIWNNSCKDWTSLEKIDFYAEKMVNLYQSFNGAISLKQVVFHGDLKNVTWNNPFLNCNAIELYDFSHTTAVFALPLASYLPHANGCVIRVPQTLLTEWQASTNWNVLTDVVWEGV